MPTSSVSSMVVLGKRKERTPSRFVLRLKSPSSAGRDSHGETEFEVGSSLGPLEAGISGISVSAKRFVCTYKGCAKSYSKPSRLAEHVRSHTGDRPYSCTICNKSYLRESHLQAHSRSHLDQSERPLACDEPGCDRRFWTLQHLRVHTDLHKGEKPFKCTEPSCGQAFMKHHQLRQHICTTHAPPGTKSYRCSNPQCDKSFSTNQHLRTHLRTHDERRYTCVNPACLIAQTHSPVFYPTWSALQHHVRTAHPPKCPYPSCNGKTFSAQKGLRAHLKIHEQREVEDGLHAANSDADDDTDIAEPPAKRRRGGEVGREWICDFEGCSKDFKSKKALNTHRKVNHEGRRDFICPHETCGRSFGYKHLLQRHLSKLHAAQSEAESNSDEGEAATENAQLPMAINDITGKTYADRSAKQLAMLQRLACPYPHLHDLSESLPSISGGRSCEYVFSRAYDLRRHLKAEHGVEVEKEVVDRWVQEVKAGSR